ncbi:MAG: DEAD/DEAH box helicase, partial [Dehalococcoidia bacterium]|nr:DEAD/DEAH box helicase [Dehalococcoidia bacterium]
MSHSLIAPPPNAEFDEETERYVDADRPERGVVLQNHYQNRGPILVDEAHNFRNVNGRSIGLRSYLEAGNHRVVLLSATPQNLGPRDIYRQLRLFLDETEHGLNIEPLGLEDYFRNAIRWHQYRAEDENYKAEFSEWNDEGRKGAPPIKPDPPNVPMANVEQVLTPVFIRRRRRDIRELYADATIQGEPVSFPEPRLDNVEYRLDRVYSKAGSFDELESLLKRHRATRYRITDYIKPEAAQNRAYRDLFRAKNRIARLMRALLFKRLESSVAAFRSTLNSLIRSNRNFRDALERGFVPVGSAATRLLAGESFDAEDALEALRQEEDRISKSGSGSSKLFHSTDDFLVSKWLEDIDADYETLNEILNRVQDIGPVDADKLRVLREFLDKPDVKSGKVLIFSEAETTIEYLHEQLNPSGASPKIARLTGSTRGSATDIVRRFAPGSNPGPHEVSPDKEIRTLLATDIISEGQNLQDCARILNYDLHWNPVRLIQRFGRIDRIGSEYETIHLHNMWPDTEVDAELDLTDRLHNRIQSFHDLIGLDSKLLSESERLNEKEMYGIYSGQMPEAEDGLDEVATNQRAIALLQRIQDDDPGLWTTIESLPDGIRSALAAKTGGDVYGIEGSQVPLEIDGSQMPLMSPSNSGSGPSPFDEPGPGETLVLLGSGDVKGCYAVSVDADGNPEPRPISPAQFISAAECAPDTPAQPLPQDTNERVMAAFESFQSDLNRRLGRARRRRPDSRNRRYISRQLNIDRAQAEPSDMATIETLRRIFLGDLSPQVE